MVPEHRKGPDEPAAARAEIEQTRARMSDTLDEIEDVLLKKKDDFLRKKEEIRASLDIGARIREKPLQVAGVVIALGFVIGFLTGGDKKTKKKHLQAEERADLWQGRARRLLNIAREQEMDIEELEEQLTEYGDLDDADTSPDAYLGQPGVSEYRLDADQFDDEAEPFVYYDDGGYEEEDEGEDLDDDELDDDDLNDEDLDDEDLDYIEQSGDSAVGEWIGDLRRRWHRFRANDDLQADEADDEEDLDEGRGVATRLTDLKDEASDRAGELLTAVGLRVLRALQRRL